MSQAASFTVPAGRLNKKQALAEFRQLPSSNLRGVERLEAWRAFVLCLFADNRISDKQRDTWHLTAS